MIRDEYNAIEAKSLGRGAGAEQVAVMDRIERPAQMKLGLTEFRHRHDCQNGSIICQLTNLTSLDARDNHRATAKTGKLPERIGKIIVATEYFPNSFCTNI